MKIQLNCAFRGMKGTLDDVTYKRFEDRTISVPKPDPHIGPPTTAQVLVPTDKGPQSRLKRAHNSRTCRPCPADPGHAFGLKSRWNMT